MLDKDSNRIDLLNKLINMKLPLAPIVKSLQQFSWDSEEPLVMLRKSDIISVLKRYLQSELTENEVEDWADAIELREDINFENESDELILEAIHELANPLLTSPLTHKTAEELIRRLS